jgi:hypothetical protein
MNARYFFGAAIPLLLAAVDVARAERPSESREDATHVVVGEVVQVFVDDSEYSASYVVKIAVEKVERGTGVAKDDYFYVECFKTKPTPEPRVGPGGHKAVPKPNQKIRAFVMKGPFRSEGLYPDWFEVVK